MWFMPDSKSEVDLPSSSPVIAANEGYSRTELLLVGGSYSPVQHVDMCLLRLRSFLIPVALLAVAVSRVESSESSEFTGTCTMYQVDLGIPTWDLRHSDKHLCRKSLYVPVVEAPRGKGMNRKPTPKEGNHATRRDLCSIRRRAEEER